MTDVLWVILTRLRGRAGMALPSASPRDRDESGSITPFVVIVSLGILMLAGLVIDGGRQLNAKGIAVAYAQEAARAGSQAVDVADPSLDLLPDKALGAAAEYCDQAMAADAHLVRCVPNMTTVNDPGGTYTAVEVETSVEIDAILLSMVGRHELHSGGNAVARPISGISEADSGKQSTLPPPSVAPPGEGAPPSTAPPEPPEDEIPPCDPDDDKNDDGDKGDGDKGGGDKNDGDKGDGSKDDGDGDDDLEPCETPKPGS